MSGQLQSARVGFGVQDQRLSGASSSLGVTPQRILSTWPTSWCSISVLLLVAHIRGVAIFVEQPTSSLLRSFEPFKSFWKYALRHTAPTYLGAFGATTPKPIDIMSNCSEVQKLKRPSPKGLDRLTSKGSNGAVNGKKNMM